MSSLSYSVIVPAYHAVDVIGQCVEALLNQTIDRAMYEIIVVDDGSEDETPDIAAAAGADVVIRAAHGGSAAARNVGIASAKGDILLFTDADCVPSPDWIARMVEPFKDPKVVGTKGTYRTRQGALIARLTQLEFEIRYQRMRHFRYIDFIDTYAAAYRKEILTTAHGFNTEYVAAEDVELSFRLARAGHRMVFVPEAWVWHLHPATLSSYLRRKMRFGYWRALLYAQLPEKISGDAHTDPMLKPQFGLLAVALGFGVGAFVYYPLAYVAFVLLGLFFVTTLPFVRWAWSRDRTVALAWPGVTFLRVLLQGATLGAGFVLHKIRPSHSS
jgi:cellulose synthase/poly-beta-1,6-N-acetylglucosamine synthase-like glycosyltransferase